MDPRDHHSRIVLKAPPMKNIVDEMHSPARLYELGHIWPPAKRKLGFIKNLVSLCIFQTKYLSKLTQKTARERPLSVALTCFSLGILAGGVLMKRTLGKRSNLAS